VFYSTNKTSAVFNISPAGNLIKRYDIEDDTTADNGVVNLAAGQLAFDSSRNAIWFTDARTNSVDMLDMTTDKIERLAILTENAGPMGIVLSPDAASVWFTEITGNKIARIDVESMKMTEYATGEDSGPTLLAFDSNGILWATLSFSNRVLRIDTQSLISMQSLSSMTELRLSGEDDTFSPFGIAVSGGKVYVSDHSSSRVTVSDTGFVTYVSYWTSPSIAFPTTLPSQVVADRQENIYFAQHGGNRISVIDERGIMTEYEVLTGPLSTAVFIAASDDERVWFAEWASNKLAYLDTSIQVPFTLNVEETVMSLDASGSQSF
jgi:streptogramin lyase